MWTSAEHRNSLNLDAPLFTLQASAQIKHGLQPLIWQDHHRRRKPCVGLRSVRGDQSRQMINKTQLKDTLDVFSCQFRIRLCCIIGRPGRHTDLPETWEPSGEETCELWFSLKSFLFHSSPQRNDWGWWQSSPSFYGWRRSRLGGRIYFKKLSSINRSHNDTGKEATYSSAPTHFSFSSSTFSIFHLIPRPWKKNTQIYSCVAAEMWNLWALRLKQPDAATGTGCETAALVCSEWRLRVGQQGELMVKKIKYWDLVDSTGEKIVKLSNHHMSKKADKYQRWASNLNISQVSRVLKCRNWKSGKTFSLKLFIWSDLNHNVANYWLLSSQSFFSSMK